MEIVKKMFSTDSMTIKYLQRGEDGFIVETSYIDYPNKHIICFSSQVGCIVGCRFCATGLRPRDGRYVRSLETKELIEQCKNVIQDQNLNAAMKPILFSCMGEGEPLLNFMNVVESLKLLGSQYANSRLAVSTSGPKPALIRELARIEFAVPFKLQVSIHGPNDTVRRAIIPVARPINEIVESVRYYRDLCKRSVDWNYVLMRSVNDAPDHALELALLLGPGWHVKFNALNPVDASPFVPAEKGTVQLFREILEAHGLTTEYYETNGPDIGAACGQLTYSVSNQQGLAL